MLRELYFTECALCIDMSGLHQMKEIIYPDHLTLGVYTEFILISRFNKDSPHGPQAITITFKCLFLYLQHKWLEHKKSSKEPPRRKIKQQVQELIFFRAGNNRGK